MANDDVKRLVTLLINLRTIGAEIQVAFDQLMSRGASIQFSLDELKKTIANLEQEYKDMLK